MEFDSKVGLSHISVFPMTHCEENVAVVLDTTCRVSTLKVIGFREKTGSLSTTLQTFRLKRPFLRALNAPYEQFSPPTKLFSFSFEYPLQIMGCF